jgi:asparagine synthase (glutamine-hydrolysing)
VLRRLLDALAHRGPDGEGIDVNGRYGAAAQPAGDHRPGDGGSAVVRAGGSALVGNGEIYNNPELREAMANTPFRTRSDCEPPVFLYEAEGEGFARRLRGMFGIAVHDPKRGRLVVTRAIRSGSSRCITWRTRRGSRSPGRRRR